jgi:hypothetical protein
VIDHAQQVPGAIMLRLAFQDRQVRRLGAVEQSLLVIPNRGRELLCNQRHRSLNPVRLRRQLPAIGAIRVFSTTGQLHRDPPPLLNEALSQRGSE